MQNISNNSPEVFGPSFKSIETFGPSTKQFEDSKLVDFNNLKATKKDINVLNYNQEAINTSMSNIKTIISKTASIPKDIFSNLSFSNSNSNSNTTSLLSRVSRVPGEAKKILQRQGLEEEQARLVTIGALGSIGVATTIGGGVGLNQLIKNPAPALNVLKTITNSKVGKTGLIGTAAVAGLLLLNSKRGDAAEISQSIYAKDTSFEIDPAEFSSIDADTFYIKNKGKVRLEGADSPELSVYDKVHAKTNREKWEAKRAHEKKLKDVRSDHKRSKVDYNTQDQGNEARAVADKFIKSAQNINLTIESQDVYGRKVVSIANEKGELLSDRLVREGLAFTELPSSEHFDGSDAAYNRYNSMIEAYQQKIGIFAKEDFINPTDFRKGKVDPKIHGFKKRLETEIKSQEFKKQGLANNEYAFILSDEDTYFTLSASLGASAHYGASIESTLMKQAGYDSLANVVPYKGLAESLMEYNNTLLGNEPLSSWERFAAQAYDTGLSAGGVGNWLNRSVFIPKGWGRLYKDEIGALPSIAGIAGKILDESYLYYANMNPDAALLGQDYKSGLRRNVMEDKSGMFQTMFEDTTSFALAMAQSLGMYVAVTQPLEMLSANISKSYIDNTLQSVLLSNTARNGGILPIPKIPIGRIAAEYYFGSNLASYTHKEGGLASAVFEQKILKDTPETPAFFAHNGGEKSGYKVQLMIQRGRAETIMKGIFKPFLMDVINPFNASVSGSMQEPNSPTGARRINSYDQFNLAVDKLIKTISKPVDLDLKFKANESFSFRGIESIQVENISEDIKIAAAKSNKKEIHIKRSALVPVSDFSTLSSVYKSSTNKINTHLIQNNEELFKILTDKNGAALSAEVAHNIMFRNGGKKEALKLVPQIQKNKVDILFERKEQLRIAKQGLSRQLGVHADQLEITTTGTGSRYKTNIAAALQDILEMIPLNPLKWGLFNGSAEYADEFISVGQLFSFRDAADYTERVLTGQTSISAVFKQFEVVTNDVDVHGKRVLFDQNISNKVKARLESVDRILGQVWTNIKSLWAPEPKDTIKIVEFTKQFRKQEVLVLKAAEKAKMEGFRFAHKANTLDPSKASLDMVVGNVDESVDLLDKVLDYSHAVKKDGISLESMNRAIDSAGIRDVTGQLMRNSKRFSGNVRAEGLLQDTKSYFAVAVFMGLALNNMMQSTKGTSIATQVGFALFGEDEDLAVKFEANRFIPTEVLTVALNNAGIGVSQTAVNFVTDSALIAGTYGLGYSVAKRMTTENYLPYTFDIETVQKMAQREAIEIVDKVGRSVDKSIITNMAPGHDSIIKVRKTVSNTDNIHFITETILTRTNEGFKTERILQKYAENVPTRAFMFGAIALLATNALREVAVSTLTAMSESPDDKIYFGMVAGLGLGGLLLGAWADNSYVAKTVKQGKEVAKARGQILDAGKNIFKTKAVTGAIAGAFIGGAFWMVNSALDPDVKQKGSLDPLIAGVGLGIGAGIFKSSAGLGLGVGIVAASVMSALNWAGIRVTKIGRGGKELDPESTKLVAQLSSYSSAVLEKENNDNTFSVGMSAYAAQFGGTKTLATNIASVGETQVIAKQSPLPILQFFVAEKIEGRRGEVKERTGPDSERTIRKYSLGIQSGAILGTSLSVELPIAYTPGEGFFGFTYNSENNLMAVPNFAIKVGVWAAAATAGVGIVYNTAGWMSKQVYNLTGAQMFNAASANFNQAAGDLFSASRFVMNASEKITSFFIRTSVSIFSTLQGTDAQMAYELFKNSVPRATQAADMLREFSTAELSVMSPGETAKLNTLDNVDGAKGLWGEIKEGGKLRYADQIKYLAIGAFLGGVAGSLTSDVVKHFKLKSSIAANESQETLLKIEDQEERRKAIYLAIGGSAGGILNLNIRSSIPLIKSFSRNPSTTVIEFLKSKNTHAASMAEDIERTMTKVGSNMSNNKYVSIVLNNKITKFVFKNSALLSKNKLGGIFFAATIYNYAKTSSEFGIAQMMDRHIVYDNKGNAYDDYNLNTKGNFLHHAGVAGILGLGTTGIASITISPNRNQRQTLINFAQKELANIQGIKTTGVLNKIKVQGTNILFSVSRWASDKESTTLLKSLLNLNNEFKDYEEYLEGVRGNPAAKLPTHLEKVEDVLKLRHALGKEELQEFIALQNQKAKGLPFATEEESTYKKFLTNIDEKLTQVNGKGISKLNNLDKGFQRISSLTSFSKRATAFLVVGYLVKLGITTVGNQGGEIGKDSYLDRLYNKANQVGKIGQRRQDGSIVGLEGFISIGADALRIITGRDIADLNTVVSSLDGKMIKSTGQKLRTNAKGIADLQKGVKDLSEMLIVDNPNAYLATFDFGGRTLRNDDKGLTSSSYFQLQGPGQDISTATYSMASKFIFSQYTGGRGRLSGIIDKGLATFDKNNPDTWDVATVNIRNATSMMDAMKNARQYSRDTSAALAGDSLANMILSLRQEALAHIAWQPTDSLYTNMFWENYEKLKVRKNPSNVNKFLNKLARSEKSVLNEFAKLMEEGIFENFFTKSAITNVIFFTGSGKQPPQRGNAQFMSTDISQLWYQTQDLSVQAEMFKQSRIELYDQYFDKVIMPLSSSGIFAIIPEWMKIAGISFTVIGVSAVIVNSIATITENKTFNQSTSELLDIFGRVENTIGPKMKAYPNDTKKIIKELKEHIAQGQKYNWNVDGHIAKGSSIVPGSNSVIGLLNIGQEGKALHVRFEINPYFEALDVKDSNIFINTLETKGEHLRNLFTYVEDTLDESNKTIGRTRKSIASSLLDHREVQKWFNKNSTGNIIESVYDIFTTTHTIISKSEFIGSAVTNFQDKFKQGLDRLFDLNDMNKVNHHLLQTVMVNGEEMLVAELLDPDFHTSGISNADEFGPATSLESRKQVYIQKYQEAKLKFQKEVQEIVEQEYSKIAFKGKGSTLIDDTAQIAEANRKALMAIKTKMVDPSSSIGAVVKGAGIIQATTLLDQQATISEATKGSQRKSNKSIVRDNSVKGNPIDTFTDDVWETLHYTRPLGNVGFWDNLAAGGKGLIVAGCTFFDVLSGADVLGSYLRVAEIQSNPYATDLDKEMASKELGRSLLASLIGVGLGLASNKLLGIFGNEKVRNFLTKPSNIVKSALGLVTGGLIGGAAWKSIIGPGLDKLAKKGSSSNIENRLNKGFADLGFTAGDFLGKVASAPVIGAYNLGNKIGIGKEAAFFTGGFSGGFVLGSIVGTGLAAFGLSISLPVLALSTVGVGLAVGVAAIFGGKQMTSGMSYATKEFMKIPIIGQSIGLTDPYRAIRNQERFKHNFKDSPFLLGYVGDIVNSNWMQLLSAAENPGGRDTVALLFGDVLGQGEEYNTGSAWKQNAAESSIGGPRPIIDEVIQNELRIRAEAYSDAVIGRYSWEQILAHADNSNVIKSQEALQRAEKVKIQEKARAQLLKSAKDAGGPTAALKTGNSRTSAVTQQQLAKIEQVYNDLDTYGKPHVQVTAASVTTHKSKTSNSDLKAGDKAKAQTINPGGTLLAPITKNHVYKTKVVINNKMAVINFNKEQDPMNPILLAQAEVMGANKANSPDVQTQVNSYNAYKNEN